jgi:transposase
MRTREINEQLEISYVLLIREIAKNKLKRVDKRLQVIRLYMEGISQCKIAKEMGFTREWVCKLIKSYHNKGLEEYARHKYGGNRRNMSEESEREILSQFEDDSNSGKLVIAKTIKKAFDEKLGRDTGRGYIYMLLNRHKARKIAPRTAHPKKASDEVVETSKKLTLDSGN